MTDRQETLDREARLALPVAIASVAAVVLVFVLPLVASNAILDGSGDAAFLRSIDENSGLYLALQAGVSVGFLLLIAPLTYLFKAVTARSATAKTGLIGVMYVSPIFLAASTMAMSLVSLEAASEFVASGVTGEGEAADEAARDLRSDQGAGFSIAIGLLTAGRLGFAVGMAYAAYQSMKVGLLTRFWGSLGAALGAVSFIFMEFAIAWFLYLGLLIAGWTPGGRPPAWEAGEALPWPTPGAGDEDDEDDEGWGGEPEPEPEPSGELEYRDPGDLEPFEPGGPEREAGEPEVPEAPAPSRAGGMRKRKRRS